MSLQASLFRAEGGGYRLMELQVYNWGTFGEKQVWKLNPNGKTSLLTGSNGSGKTTLVDALLTLLVPSRPRFYNQSSGTKTTKDRDERSYILGAFGLTQAEGRSTAQTQYLREPQSTYTVLLAYFYNQGLQHHFSIGAVMRVTGSNAVNQDYFTASRKLDIVEDRIQYEPGRNWKERLRKTKQVNFHNSFSQYRSTFEAAFGMRTKAVGLFNKAVGIKVLGQLDKFIREEMLDRGDPEAEYEKLLNSFQTLLSSHRAFEKARKQLELLEPVKEQHDTCQSAQKEVDRLNQQKKKLPIWFDLKQKALLEEAIEREGAKLRLMIEQRKSGEEEIKNQQQEAAELRAAVAGNETGRRIKELEKAIKGQEKELNRKKGNEGKYNREATKIGLKESPNGEEFLENRSRATEIFRQAKDRMEELDEQRYQARREKENLEVSHKEQSEELADLLKRKTRIPAKNVELRSRILLAVGAREQEIPFVGEVLKVREEEAPTWEEAAERILHNFALRLLVPPAHYREVNRFVKNTNLGGRLIYHQVDPREPDELFHQDEPEALYAKLEIKADTPYFSWIERQLHRRFDHYCTADLEVFEKCKKALTPEGLSKDLEKHEKDDSPRRVGPQNYILGWENKSKIRLIRDYLKKLEEDIKIQEQNLRKIQAERKAEEKRKEAAGQLKRLESFEELNWQAVSVKIDQSQKELEQLRKSSDRLREMERQLKALEKKIEDADQSVKSLIKQETKLEELINVYRSRLMNVNSRLQGKEPQDWHAELEILSDWAEKFTARLTVENLGTHRDRSLQQLTTQLDEQKDALRGAQNQLQVAMLAYKNPVEEIRQQFKDWTGETHELGSGIEYVLDYLEIYRRIEEDDLLKYQEAYKQYLDEKMVGDMASFHTALRNRKEDIEDHIQELNQSLRQIDYKQNPATYIQLTCRDTNRQEVREFQSRLKSDWKFDTGEYERTRDSAILDQSFARIRTIIESLKNDENYRNRVIDVRNWLDFEAAEYYQEGGGLANVYPDTGHLSGGEKAQITYTILGAALAYQFGIDRGGHKDKSFRFIVVDEAFSKLDPEKSRYLMELCDQLHLQLLVVTPLDKIHVAEPYIHACHYVENPQKRHSRVYNLTMEEYQEKKEIFLAEQEVGL